MIDFGGWKPDLHEDSSQVDRMQKAIDPKIKKKILNLDVKTGK